MRLPRKVVDLLPGMILVLGWLAVIAYARPGLMTMDSIQQLIEAREGFYTDAHPPLMAVIWHFVDKIIAGPFGMLVLQTVAFEAGLYLVLRRALSPLGASIATVLLFLFPPVLAPLAVIWKDCVMAGMLLLGTAALLSSRRGVKVWGLAALALATAVRYNAPAATGPLIFLLFTWTWERGLKRYALAAVVWIATTVVALGVGRLVTDQPMYFWHSTLALMDTAGAIANTDDTVSDDELRALTAGTGILVDHDFQAAIRRQYSPLDFEQLIARDGHLWEMPISGKEPAPEAKREAIARMFWGAVTGHFGGYLIHRAMTMKYVLGLHDGPVYSPVMMHKLQYKDLLEKIVHVEVAPTGFQNYVQRRVLAVAKKTPLFRPWLYLVLSLVLLGVVIYRRRDLDVAALLLSGLGLEASLFLLAPTPDYRYSHWMVCCTLLAAVILAVRRIRDVRSARAV